jgi:hypothetical protein
LYAAEATFKSFERDFIGGGEGGVVDEEVTIIFGGATE